MATQPLSTITKWIQNGDLTLSQAARIYQLSNEEKKYLQDFFRSKALARKREEEALKGELLADIKARPQRYYAEMVQLLLDGRDPLLDDEEEAMPEDVFYRFIKTGETLTAQEILEAAALHANISIDMVCAGAAPFPDILVDEYKGSPLPPKSTDVYVLGAASSGKTSLLAGLIRSLVDDFGASFQATENDSRQKAYYDAVMALPKEFHSFPPTSSADTLLVCPLKIGRKYLNIIDSGRRGMADLSKLMSVGQNKSRWLHDLMRNDNDKMFFFLIDYQMLIDDNVRTIFRQVSALANLVRALTNDGNAGNEHKNCTMSHAKTVALVFTKTDCAAESEGQIKERIDNFISEYLLNLKSDVADFFPVLDINKANNNELYVLAHSLGKVTLGNTLLPDTSDSRRLAQLVVDTCPSRGLFGIF